MIHRDDKNSPKVGKIVGYLFSYFLFATVLYFILKYTDKLPNNWSYINIVLLTLGIVFIGLILGKILR